MTYEEVREYRLERGEDAHERYLIEAIEQHTTDPSTRELIQWWFDQVE